MEHRLVDKIDLISIQKIMSKEWIIGFIEAEGSFFITKKGKNSQNKVRYEHGFSITQKYDPIVLDSIRRILHIRTKIRFREKHNFYILDTTHKRSLQNIIDYLICEKSFKLKGIKSLEFKI